MTRKIIRSDSGNSAAIPASRGDRPDRPISGLDDQDAFTSALLDDLDPRGPAESLIASRMALAGWKLSRGSGTGRAEAADARDERAFYRGLHALTKLRASGRARRWGAEAPPLAIRRIDEGDFAEVHGLDEPRDRSADPAESDATYGALWRDRLVIDARISERSPIVKGTFVTVGHVISLIVDGSTWDDILRDHPELTEHDIRACVAFAVEEDGDGLPY